MNHESIIFLEDFCFGRSTIKSFEQSLYSSQKIEMIVGNKNYLAMLELDFNDTKKIICKLPWLMKLLLDYDPIYYRKKIRDMSDSLLTQIREAFINVLREGGISFHQAIVLENRGTNKEFHRAIEYDIDDGWESIRDSMLVKCPECAHHLDDIGMKYYLPAYLRYILTVYEDNYGDCRFDTLVNGVLARLTANGNDMNSMSIRNLLSHSQKHVVSKCLYWMIIALTLNSEGYLFESSLLDVFDETWWDDGKYFSKMDQ